MARSVKPGLAHDEDIRVATHCEFVFVCAVFLVPAEPREGKGQLDHLAPQTRQRKTVQVRRASRRQQQEHQQAAGAREAWTLCNLVAVDAGAYGVDHELEDVRLVSNLIDGEQVLVRELQRV